MSINSFIQQVFLKCFIYGPECTEVNDIELTFCQQETDNTEVNKKNNTVEIEKIFRRLQNSCGIKGKTHCDLKERPI